MNRPNYRQREKIRARLKATATECAICGRPFSEDEWWVDPKDGKRKRHPLSMEYDHVVPASLSGNDGQLLHGFGNAQAVHRICNQKKGNRMPAKAPDGPSEGAFQQLPTSRAW